MKAGELIAGRYRLEAKLGEGGNGVVWRATQMGLDRPVALKLLRAGIDDARARARFEREARVASALAHVGAVGTFDFGEHEGRPFLAMELAEGTTLRSTLSAGMLPVSVALDVAHQLTDVLRAAHALGLVHRDLKPENVMIGPDGRARVLDFGLAFLHGSERDARLTREGVVAGTPRYLSPEQAQGAEVGPPTDVYALGCVLFEMLTGTPPFVGSDVEVLTRHLYAPPPPLRAPGPIPAPLEPLVARMLDKRADHRPTAEQTFVELDSLDPGHRGRSRLDPTLGRSGRVVPPAAPPERDAVLIELAVVGTVSAEVLVALAASGVAAYVVTDEQPLGEPTAILAVGASPDRVAELVGVAPVVADADPSDVARLRALIRAGAAEVAPAPILASDVVRRVGRTLRRGRS